MRRREFITLLGGAVAAWPLAVRAQQGECMRRIGVPMSIAENDPEGQSRVTALEQGLRSLDWRSGDNVTIDYRWAAGDPNRMETYSCHTSVVVPVSKVVEQLGEEP
jgi:putative ABC transport system substrate-binding protein